MGVAIIVWNVFDVVIHVVNGYVELWRIAGNVAATLAAAILLMGSSSRSAVTRVRGAAVVVAVLNAVHAALNGYGIPMLVFVGVTVLLLNRGAQLAAPERTLGGAGRRLAIAAVAAVASAGLVVLTDLLFGA